MMTEETTEAAADHIRPLKPETRNIGLEQRQHWATRKVLYEELHPETISTRRGGPGRRKKRTQSHDATESAPAFIDDAAKKTGKDRSTIARYVAQACKIVNMTDFVGTYLDQDNELPALAKLPAEVQRALAKRIQAGEK
jgi:hypothetical protein